MDQSAGRAAHRASGNGDGTRLVRGIGTPIKLRRTPGGTRRPPPKFAAGWWDVLAQHGYSRGRDRGAATRRRVADRTPHVAAEPAKPGSGNMCQGRRCRARQALKLPVQTTVSWAVFDAAWHLATYPDARVELGDTDDAAVLQFYLEHGQARGHSPNIWFDEAWHLKAHPGAARGGARWPCGIGIRRLLPRRSPLPRPALAVPGRRGFTPALSGSARRGAGGRRQYQRLRSSLKHGSREGRIGHILSIPRCIVHGLMRTTRGG